MKRTRWTVEHDGVLGEVTITLKTSDPAVVRLVEEAAQRHGVRLARLLDAIEPDEHDEPSTEGGRVERASGRAE